LAYDTIHTVIFEDCKLFRDIVQSRSVSRGASLNGISQSAASQHLQEMERRLELTLLDRSVRPLEITPAGKLYYDLCRDVLRREDEFRSACDLLKKHVDGQIRVASIYSIGLSEMTRLRTEFELRFPEAELKVEFARPDRIYEAVLADDADLGLVSYPESSRDLTVIPWREEQMSLAAAPSHPLAAKSVIELKDLDGEEFIGFDEELPIRRHIDRFLREAGIEVHVAMKFDNLQMIKEAVALGSGISILPDRSMQAEIEQGRLVSIPLLAPGLVRPVGIVHRRRKKLNRAAQSFLDLLECQVPA
jgi:LysR family transcriptional regulator, transcriptional activator of the cysJI operon